MELLTPAARELRKSLEVEIEQLHQERIKLDKRLTELQRKADALRVMEELEVEAKNDAIPQLGVNIPTRSSKWKGIPLKAAAVQLLEGNPEWKLSDRREQIRLIENQLIEDNFDFAGKRPNLSINMALTQLGRQEKAAIGTDKEEIVSEENQGTELHA